MWISNISSISANLKSTNLKLHFTFKNCLFFHFFMNVNKDAEKIKQWNFINHRDTKQDSVSWCSVSVDYIIIQHVFTAESVCVRKRRNHVIWDVGRQRTGNVRFQIINRSDTFERFKCKVIPKFKISIHLFIPLITFCNFW